MASNSTRDHAVLARPDQLLLCNRTAGLTTSYNILGGTTCPRTRCPRGTVSSKGGQL